MAFAGGVAFGSDQGMFVQNWTNRSELQLYSADGDLNNNVSRRPDPNAAHSVQR